MLNKKYVLIKLLVVLLILPLTLASSNVYGKTPKLDRYRVADIINQTEGKLYDYHEADPLLLKKYKWIKFDKKKVKNVYELWYRLEDNNKAFYVYYTFNKKQEPKIVRVGGTIPIDNQDWTYKSKWLNWQNTIFHNLWKSKQT